MIWLFCVLGLALAEDSDDPMKSLDAFEIKGTVQEPLELTESFIPKIIESMKTSPL